VASSGAFFFILATPKTVFTVVASQFSTLEIHRTRSAHGASGCFPANPAFRTFASDAEEEVCSTLARGVIHPFRSSDCEQHGFHLNSWVREPSDVVVMRCNQI
jgi:hypothetical protein